MIRRQYIKGFEGLEDLKCPHCGAYIAGESVVAVLDDTRYVKVDRDGYCIDWPAMHHPRFLCSECERIIVLGADTAGDLYIVPARSETDIRYLLTTGIIAPDQADQHI